MSNFIDEIRTVDVPVFDEGKSGPPNFWWFNGSRQDRSGGIFYTNTDQGVEPVDPWMPSTRFDNEDGFETSMLRIAVIGIRQQAFRKIDDRRVYLPAWEPGAQLHTEVLCFADGIDTPVVWSAKGLTGKAISGKSGIILTYRNGLLREAERKAKKKLPLWTFWLPISTKIDQHARVVYTSTGYSNNVVTLPALHLPHDDLDTCMHELYVGKGFLEWGAEVRQEYDGWLKHRRGNETAPQAEEEQKETASVSVDADDEGDLPY